MQQQPKQGAESEAGVGDLAAAAAAAPPSTPSTPPSAPIPAPYGEDWTAHLVQTDHVRFFRSRDWATSSLGPLLTWSPTLQLFVRMLFADSRPACLWWEPDLVAIYNEGYSHIAAKNHPDLMGAAFRDGWSEIWDEFKLVFELARQTGKASEFSSAIDSPMMLMRHGWKEETFFTGNIVPIGVGTSRRFEGFYNSCFEVTSQRLTERRTAMLNRMASVPNLTLDSVCTHIISSLETNPHDIPMAMLYEADHQSESTTLRLRGHIGVPVGHDLLIDGENITSPKGLMPDCRRAGLDPLMIDLDARFNQLSWRGFEQPSKNVAILPVAIGSRILGYLIAGTNPRRPYDDACEQFLKDLGRMSSSLLSAAVSAQEAKRQQQRLEDDLAASDMNLRHLIEHASVGMVHLSLEGDMIWANDHYYALTNRSTEQPQDSSQSFFENFLDDDRPGAKELWAKLVQGANHVSAELRTNIPWKPPVGEDEPTQVQVLAFPYRENGKVKSIMACTTDISRLKWAEKFQARLADEAREAKRQQEAFIDVVSHEMRNPLSAIVHCADQISTCLDECRSRLAEIPQPCLDTLTENVATANIIMQCANHQKRIIDDVLTLSKLDAMLLSITPTATKPVKLINNIVGIFEAELKSDNIECEVQPQPSFTDLGIEYLNVDPYRVTQIFINLLTNAIKFVKSTSSPTVTIRYGATLSNPRAMFPPNMFWAPRGKHEDDVTNNAEWGTGEVLYLTFLVKDTGIGMQEKEIYKIFERFKQANMRTHVKYGGSGLGLFISKELTEKQGGEIGVCSILGHGSTFGFYVKSRRAEKRPKALRKTSRTDTGSLVPQQLGVLLVEDNLINQKLLRQQLERAGCEVDVANHGLEALKALEEARYDIILMDMEMPVMDGLSATKEIRRRQRQGKLPTSLPVVAVTANVRQEQSDTAFAAGADRVMHKPYKVADLVAVMQELVSEHDLNGSVTPSDVNNARSYVT